MAKVEIKMGEIGGGSSDIEYAMTSVVKPGGSTDLTIPTTKKAKGFILSHVLSSNLYTILPDATGIQVYTNGGASSHYNVTIQYTDSSIVVSAFSWSGSAATFYATILY